MEVRFAKCGESLVPFDPASAEWLAQKREGQYLEADIKIPRNNQFKAKFFKLLTIAFHHWNPDPVATKWGEAGKTFEQFREDVTIAAGFYVQTVRLDGSIRTKAKSISFAKMEEPEFEVLYSRVLDVLIRLVLKDWTIEDIDREIGSFL